MYRRPYMLAIGRGTSENTTFGGRDHDMLNLMLAVLYQVQVSNENLFTQVFFLQRAGRDDGRGAQGRERQDRHADRRVPEGRHQGRGGQCCGRC